MERLTCPTQAYAWGSTTAIATLLGRPASGEPEAELWMGTHERGPAVLDDGSPLADRTRLPFLMKILAAAQPLSLQAHPNKAQAEAGFAREDDAGIAVDAPNRSYRDTNHKPELICALEPFAALCGFREPAETIALFESLGVPALDPVIAALGHTDPTQAGHDALALLLNMPEPAATDLSAQVARAAGSQPLNAPFPNERAWTLRCAELYPTGAGVVTALLLNLVLLEPGQALFLGPGNLHAYLEGVGIEIMAESDNVLRGGMTVKHVDVPELLAVVDTTPGVAPVQECVGDVHRYDSEAPEFALTRLTGGASQHRKLGSDEVVLSLGGPAELTADGAGAADPASGRSSLTLEAGEVAWVPQSHGGYTIDAAPDALVFVAGSQGANAVR